MNKEQFIYWLKGYTAGHEHAPTLKQWETIVSELDKIKDCPDYGSPIEEFKPNPMWQEPHYPNQFDKYKITCGNGTANSNSVIVTDGFIQNLSVTRAQPPSTLTTTSTAYGHPSGSTVSYTANLPKEDNQLELDLE
jgi:hypothetical protein